MIPWTIQSVHYMPILRTSRSSITVPRWRWGCARRRAAGRRRIRGGTRGGGVTGASPAPCPSTRGAPRPWSGGWAGTPRRGVARGAGPPRRPRGGCGTRARRPAARAAACSPGPGGARRAARPGMRRRRRRRGRPRAAAVARRPWRLSAAFGWSVRDCGLPSGGRWNGNDSGTNATPAWCSGFFLYGAVRRQCVLCFVSGLSPFDVRTPCLGALLSKNTSRCPGV